VGAYNMMFEFMQSLAQGWLSNAETLRPFLFDNAIILRERRN
jgi:hypothetical protein